MALGAGTDVGLRGYREAQIGEFAFRRSDFTVTMPARIDLDRVAATPSALWAVSGLIDDPYDGRRRERALAALLAAGDVHDGGEFDLSALRIEVAGRPVLTLLSGPESAAAYLLTPDVALADRLAARAGRLARAVTDLLCPRYDGGATEFDLDRRARQVLEHLGPELFEPGEHGTGFVIVRAERTPGQPATEMYRKLSTWVRRPVSRRLMPEPHSAG